MPVSVDSFLKHLGNSGILSSDDLLRIDAQIPKEKRANDAQQLARELVRVRKLTEFQANALYHGKPAGLTLGNYVILDKIGAGGMGQVFKAEHRRMKRLVAVKVLPKKALANPEVFKRFQREVEAAAKLTHPNIVAAFDADEFEGIHFLVMEFVDGIDLARDVKQNGPMPIEKSLDCVLQAARGLEHAHARGIIHRDIKPANLLLDKQNGIKILDMGLARIQVDGQSPSPVANESSLTQVGNIMGTVDFMSPEQALDSRSANHLSDIYSLGATWHFLLTGQPMYDGDTLMARILAHREAPVPSLRARRKDVPPQVDAIFQRMVAKKLEQRYQSVADLIRDLSDWRNAHVSAPASGSATDVPQNVLNAIFDDE
jgi:serine/threonine-protein kinase